MSTSSFTLCCAFCLLITTIAIPSNRLAKESIQNVAGPLNQTVAYNLQPAEPSHSLSTTTISTSASVNHNPTGLGINPVCSPPRRFNPIPIPPLGGCAVAILNVLNEAPEGQSDEPMWWPPGISLRNWTFMGCRVALYPKYPGSGDLFSYLDIADAASRLMAVCNTEEYGYRGGYTELDSLTRTFAVALYGVLLSNDVESQAASNTTALNTKPA